MTADSAVNYASIRIAAERQTDVLIIGAGPAGFAAAVAAARRGHAVLVVERHGAAGGAMTLGMNLTPVGFEPFKYWTTETDPDSWAVQGIARELYEAMVAARAVVKPVWDAETCKRLMDKLMLDAGVKLLYHAACVDVWMDGTQVRGALLATRDGLWRVAAKLTIDCSGDGELFAKAGAAYDMGRQGDGRPQPLALVAMVGGLKLDLPHGASYAEWMAATRAQVAPILDRAWRAKRIPPTFAGILFPRVVPGGVLRDQAWARWVPRWADPTDPEAFSRVQVEARQILAEIIAFVRAEVPGCGEAVVLHTSLEVWARESRRLRGLEVLTEDDVRSNRRRPDGIAVGCGFLEVHSATPDDADAEAGFDWKSAFSLIDADVAYDIAYGCLVPEAVEGLLVAGRCLSATHIAQSSARMQVTCMATGEAAGVAAALCLQGNWTPRQINPQELRTELVRGGARV